jgi:NAD(P)H-quinone oxidoreductase subunit 4L
MIMQSKSDKLTPSDLMTVFYVAIIALLTALFLHGDVGSWLNQIHVGAENADFVIGIVIICLSAVFLAMGANPGVLLVFGTLAAFFVLTVKQDPLIRYMTLSGILFSLGMYGMVTSRNAVRVLMCIELMLNAVNLNFIALSQFIDPVLVKGQIFAIFILTVAAAEAAVGLAIVLAIYRNNATVDMEKFNLLKW